MFEKIERVCEECKSKNLTYKGHHYVCNDCNNVDWYLRRDENDEFKKDSVGYTEYMIELALKEYNKKFKALLLMLEQKGVISDVKDLDEVLNSIDVLDKLQE